MKLHLSETPPVGEDFRDITDQVSLYLLYLRSGFPVLVIFTDQVFLYLLYTLIRFFWTCLHG